MVLLGILFFALAAITFAHGPILGNRAYPLWALCIALGAIATSGGLVSMYVGPDPPTVGPDEIDLEEFVLVPREEWKAMRTEFARMQIALRAKGAPVRGGDTAAPGKERAPATAAFEPHESVLSELEGLMGVGKVGGRSSSAAPAVASASTGVPVGASTAGTFVSSTPVAGAPAPAQGSLPPSRAFPGRAREPSLRPPEVEVPQVGEVASDQLREELDAQMRGVTKDLRSFPTGPTTDHRTEPSEVPVPVPVPIPPVPSGPISPQLVPSRSFPSSLPSQLAPAAEPPRRESYSEDNEPRTPVSEQDHDESQEDVDQNLAEIEELARKFGAITQPEGALKESPSIAPASVRAAAPSTPPASGRERTPAPVSPTVDGSRASRDALPLEPFADPQRFRLLGVSRPGSESPPYLWEVAALRAGLDYGIERKEGEPVDRFLERASSRVKSWTVAPPPPISELQRARAFVAGLLESHRNLSSGDMELTSNDVRARVERLGLAMGVPIRPEEPLVEYAQRLGEILAATRGPRDPSSGPAPSVPPSSPSGTSPSSPASPPSPKAGGTAPPSDPTAPLPSASDLDDELERMVQDIVTTTLPTASPTEPPAKRTKRPSPKDQA